MGLFSQKLTPLRYEQVVKALKSMGFNIKPKTGTSHEKWIKITPGSKKLVVTVDKPTAPFGKDLIKYMAQQAGMNVKDFHALCIGTASLKDLGIEPTKE